MLPLCSRTQRKNYPKSTPRLLCPLSSPHKLFAADRDWFGWKCHDQTSPQFSDPYHSKKHKKPSVTTQWRPYSWPTQSVASPHISARKNGWVCAFATHARVTTRHHQTVANIVKVYKPVWLRLLRLTLFLTFLNVEQVRVSQNKQDENHGNRPFIRGKSHLILLEYNRPIIM